MLKDLVYLKLCCSFSVFVTNKGYNGFSSTNTEDSHNKTALAPMEDRILLKLRPFIQTIYIDNTITTHALKNKKTQQQKSAFLVVKIQNCCATDRDREHGSEVTGVN